MPLHRMRQSISRRDTMHTSQTLFVLATLLLAAAGLGVGFPQTSLWPLHAGARWQDAGLGYGWARAAAPAPPRPRTTSLWDLLGLPRIRENPRHPFVFGYKHYSKVHYTDEPDKGYHHRFHFRVGPEPQPYYLKSAGTNSATVSSHLP